ncbi:MAG: cation transporter [Rhodoblastus sp.]|nr:cation transporter [Rhodoblastus sp.]
MDCAHCAAKVSTAARGVAGVRDAQVSIASQIMTLQLDDPNKSTPEIERAVTALGYRLDRIEDDGEATPPAHVAPAYRRALWIVVILNLGCGLVEIVGGWLAGSQAVEADALDFLGDGAISLLGLIAIRWGLRARANAALLQGVFLALLGVGVLAATAYRVFVQHAPEAGLMGALGLIALAVNVAAAVVLIPHREGDANVRAVWLFSRNDAIGNLAVVIAAGLVAWTGSVWPDLIVAAGIAGLFLQSAWSIVAHARADLGRASREAG